MVLLMCRHTTERNEQLSELRNTHHSGSIRFAYARIGNLGKIPSAIDVEYREKLRHGYER